jgi:Tfp pilus assembly protein PilV
MRRSPHCRSNGRGNRPPRPGATIIELLVALLLFDISLLTLVALNAVAVQRVGEAGRRNRAAIAASSRLESLASQPCGSSTSGKTTPEPGVTETWSSVSTAGGRDLLDSVRIDSRFPEQLVLRSRISC